MSELAKLSQMLFSLLPDSSLARWLLLVVMVTILLGWKLPILRHPRYVARFMVLILLTVAVLIFCFYGWLSMDQPLPLIVVVTFLIIYGILLFFAPKIPLFWSKIYLERLELLVAQGWSWNYETLGTTKPFYLWDFAEHFRCQLIRAKHMKSCGRFLAAWELYNSIPMRRLFPEEKEELKLAMATLAAVDLGDISTAERLLKEVQDKDSLKYLTLDSIISEVKGEMQDAAVKLKGILASPIDKDFAIRAVAYNQLGRMRRMEENYLDAVYYYQKAVNEAVKDNNKDVLHAAYQNLIGVTLLQGDINKSQQLLNEYASKLNFEIIHDCLEFMNMKVQVARQLGDQSVIIQTLVEGYDTLTKDNPKARLSLLNVSFLRSMHSAGVVPQKIMDDVTTSLDDYINTEMPSRYKTLKEIVQTLHFIEIGMSDRYDQVRSRLHTYMANQARKDIEDYIASLPPHAVNERCAMYFEKVGVIKNFESPYDFNRLYAIMKQIKDIYRENCHFVDVIECDLNIVDEALSAQRWDVMREHALQAEESLKVIKNYPNAPEFYLRLALYYFALQDRGKARSYYILFEETGTSIWHYNNWLQNYYHLLKHELG